MSLVDRVLSQLVRSNFSEGMSELEYWERFWEGMLRRFDRDGAPLEETNPWERGCNLEMVRHYRVLLGGLGGKSILELGSGGGHISALMAKEGARITLVDYSPLAMEYARRTVRYLDVSERFTLLEGDLLSVQLEQHDVCFNCGVLEHYGDEHALDILTRMAHLGKDLAAVTVPNLLSPELLYRMLRYGKGSERFMTPHNLMALIQRAGLAPMRWLPVNYWTPSFLGAGIAEVARKVNLLRAYWGLAWLFTCTFRQP